MTLIRKQNHNYQVTKQSSETIKLQQPFVSNARQAVFFYKVDS